MNKIKKLLTFHSITIAILIIIIAALANWNFNLKKLAFKVADINLSLKENSITLNKIELENLISKGFNNPQLQLKNELMKQQSIIPSKGVLGGTMFISSFKLINDRWAYANFEDGHIAGSMILRFEVKDKKVTWKIVDSTISDL